MLNRILLGIALLSPLMMGASPNHQPEFVAYAETLSPAPISPPKTEPVVKTVTAEEAPKLVTGGSPGYVGGGGNCVSFVCSLAPGLCQQGNAGTWRANSSVPSIGAVMIFRPGQQGASGAGHVGIVTGINPNGTINLAHANWAGQTTFSSTGNFYK